jgi:cell cycle checkpoint protein
MSTGSHNLPKDALDIIVETSNGDIRSAIMALQFAFVMQPRDKKGKKAIRGSANMRGIFDAVTRREQSLALFHLLGKVLYNKRK